MSVWLQKPCKIFRMVLYDVFSNKICIKFIVMNTTELVVEIRPEKKFRSLTGFESMTSAILGAALYQLS